MSITVPEAIRELLLIVSQLRNQYPQKRFTLDGRLVGDLGEILVADAYDLKLFSNLQKHHDAVTPDGRLVQIKATMQNALTFPADHIPDYYLGVQIHQDGTFTEIFNGLGSLARKVVEDRKPPKNNLYSISIQRLVELNKDVKPKDRIHRRVRAVSDGVVTGNSVQVGRIGKKFPSWREGEDGTTFPAGQRSKIG